MLETDVDRIASLLDEALQWEGERKEAEEQLANFRATRPRPRPQHTFRSLRAWFVHRQNEAAWETERHELIEKKKATANAAAIAAIELALHLGMPRTQRRLTFPHPERETRYITIRMHEDGHYSVEESHEPPNDDPDS